VNQALRPQLASVVYDVKFNNTSRSKKKERKITNLFSPQRIEFCYTNKRLEKIRVQRPEKSNSKSKSKSKSKAKN
jgi:hypothetical protein